MLKYFLFFALIGFSHYVPAATAVEQAVDVAGIKQSDTLNEKIDKALRLLNEERYFFPETSVTPLKPPFDQPYHLDSLRTPEEILSQKIGGSCGSSALAFAAILNSSGVPESDLQIVNSVVNDDLKIICPTKRKPRVRNPISGARGHVFVAVRFPSKEWVLINSIDGSRTYGRAPWYSPVALKKKIKKSAVEIPLSAYKTLPSEIYSSGLTVFQTWALKEVPLHNFDQRFDLIASGYLLKEPNQSVVPECRFTAPIN